MGAVKSWGILLLVLLFSGASWGLTTKTKQIVAMEAILAELETHYGMAEFKKQMYGLTTESLREKYTRLINQAKTLEEDLGMDSAQAREILPVEEFRQLMIGLVAELRDGHVNISRQDKTASTLGLNAAPLGEKLYVTEVRKDLIAPESSMLPIEPGDEILEINGVKITDLARRNLLYTASGTFADRFNDAMLFTVINPHSILRPQPEGQKTVVKLRKGEKEFLANLRWIDLADYNLLAQLYPKQFENRSKKNDEDAPIVYGMRGTVRSYFKNGLLANPDLKDSVIDLAAILNHEIKSAKDEKNPEKKHPESITKLSPVTRLAAYMVRANGKNIAVIRFPGYSPDGGITAIKNEYLWIAEILKRMEKLSDSLVIDQVSNTGGSVYYAVRLLSLFASEDRPLKSMLANNKLNDTFINSIRPDVSKEPVHDTLPNYVDLRLYNKYYEELKDKWSKGQEWSGLVPAMDLQARLSEDESGEIFRSKEAVYTKPILFLNDKMSGSGGDFVPNIFQQNGRALIYGETSCGLGGSVYRSTQSLPGSEMQFRCTSAYFEKPDGWPLEGIGTVPDIYREIKISDLKDGFKTYSQEVLDKASQMAGAPAPEALTREKVTPLPDALLEDIILKTLWQRHEVLNRLMEMKALPKWKDNQLLNDTVAMVENSPPGSTFADPCELRLRMTPLK